MTADIDQRIEAAKKRLDQLKAQRQKLEARKRAVEAKNRKKQDARRAFLVGTAILEEIRAGGMQQHQLDAILHRRLEHDHDRVLFGLRVKPPAVAKDRTPQAA